VSYVATAVILVVLIAAFVVVVADLARLRNGVEALSEPSPTPLSTVAESPTGAPIASDAAFVELTSEVSAGAPRVRVAVRDESGRLTGVGEKGTVDPSSISFDGRFAAYAEPGRPGRVHLTWVGGICDSNITVTIAADIRSITFDMGPQPDCDSIGVGRELVLDFAGSVDVPGINIRDAAESPTGSPAYELDCGPLGPDTCHQKAAGVIAANEKGSPTDRVVSITFIDECGSYTVHFDSGSGMTASVDCVLP
jgi:hypothetical protein